MHLLPNLLLLLSLSSILAACGGGGGSSAPAASSPGAVYVAVDTATGTGGVVQFVVGGAVLERADGSTTDDVLGTPTVVTFTDPSGELSWLCLRQVPAGDYRTLHLMLQPGTGVQRTPDGLQRTLGASLTLDVPIRDDLRHDGVGQSWLVVGHDTADLVQGTGTSAAFAPLLSARTDGSRHDVDGLRAAREDQGRLWVHQPGADDGVLEVEFAEGCECSDDSRTFAQRSEFLAGIGGDDVQITGELHRDGRLVAQRAHRSAANDNPRYFGRIESVDPIATAVLLRIEWQERRGQRTLLVPAPVVRVLAQGARLVNDDSHATIAFASLAVGARAKVEWSTRTVVAGQPDDVVAREIEVGTGEGAPLQPEWQGRVQSVQASAGTLIVERRGDDAILVNGVAVPTVTVTLAAGARLVRDAASGGGEVVIGLGDVVPGQDRIWWRGVVTGPQAITADRLRVRAQ